MVGRLNWMSPPQGAFSYSANYDDDYPGNNPENHLRNHAQPIQNSKIQTSDACHGSQGPKFCPVHCSSHSMTSFQSSELTELPAVENGQLFAQRAHSARYAPIDNSSHCSSASPREARNASGRLPGGRPGASSSFSRRPSVCTMVQDHTVPSGDRGSGSTG